MEMITILQKFKSILVGCLNASNRKEKVFVFEIKQVITFDKSINAVKFAMAVKTGFHGYLYTNIHSSLFETSYVYKRNIKLNMKSFC